MDKQYKVKTFQSLIEHADRIEKEAERWEKENLCVSVLAINRIIIGTKYKLHLWYVEENDNAGNNK